LNRFSLDELRGMAKALFTKAVSAVNPYEAIQQRLRIDNGRIVCRLNGNSEKIFRLDSFDRIFLIGTGKASAPMAQAIEKIFGLG